MVVLPQNVIDAVKSVTSGMGGTVQPKTGYEKGFIAWIVYESMLEPLGYAKERVEIKELIAEHGYRNVLVEVAKHISID